MLKLLANQIRTKWQQQRQQKKRKQQLTFMPKDLSAKVVSQPDQKEMEVTAAAKKEGSGSSKGFVQRQRKN